MESFKRRNQGEVTMLSPGYPDKNENFWLIPVVVEAEGLAHIIDMGVAAESDPAKKTRAQKREIFKCGTTSISVRYMLQKADQFLTKWLNDDDKGTASSGTDE